MNALPPFSESLGIIDLGSNSARLLVAHYTPGSVFKVTDELSRRVRLSEGMAASQLLTPAAIERALATLRVFASFCKANGVRRVIPVATAAVRDAHNQAEFLQRTQRETGLRLRVLTGEQEAYFSSLGAINSIGIQQGLVLDVGGGSAELGKVRAGAFQRGTVKPLGALSLTERFCHTDPISDTHYAALFKYIADTLAPIAWLRLRNGQQFVGLGGSVRTLARIDRETRSYPFHLVHQYELKLGRLEKLIDKLRGLSYKERARQIAGLRNDREDIILAGAMVVAAALRQASAESLTVCGQGLREGLLYSQFLRTRRPPVLSNLREFSILNLARNYSSNQAHADHVARLSLALFDQLSAEHALGARERECLWAAAQLHDIGTSIDYHNHHKHAAYIILNAALPGYTHTEQVTIAALCMLHRRGRAELEAFAPIALLSTSELSNARQMGALLRLAEYLDRSRSAAVKKVQIRIADGRAQLLATPAAVGGATVEISETQRATDLFEQEFGMPLSVSIA